MTTTSLVLHTADLGGVLLAAGRSKRQPGDSRLASGRYGPNSWFLELHVLGRFVGIYR